MTSRGFLGPSRVSHVTFRGSTDPLGHHVGTQADSFDSRCSPGLYSGSLLGPLKALLGSISGLSGSLRGNALLAL